MNPTTPIASLVTDLNEQADYPETGARNKPLHKDEQTQHGLMCLAAGTTIAEHASPRNVTVTVVAGVFIVMPANALHAVQTTDSTLAFLLSKW